MAKVSVIIPVYKVEEYLERCVQSVLNQTLKDIEIVLVDDGSPDNCPKMCDEFAKKDLLELKPLLAELDKIVIEEKKEDK